MRVEVDVRQEHIDNGTRQSECCCPIALAIREAIGCYVVVDHLTIITVDSKEYPLLCLPLPSIAQRFVKEYDSDRPVTPFKFTIELPAPVA